MPTNYSRLLYQDMNTYDPSQRGRKRSVSDISGDAAYRQEPISRKVLSDPYYFLAFGFGSGLAPRAPGTWGSVVGLLLYILAVPILGLAEVYFIAIIAIFLFAGSYTCDRVARELGEVDPGGIVLDEIVGIWVVLVALPEGWIWPLVAFTLFRLLDIWKPWPIRWIDGNVKGGVGIMLDDIAAGVLAWVLIQATNGILLA